MNEERAEVYQSADGSWTASAHNGERGWTQPGLDTERDAWARAERWLSESRRPFTEEEGWEEDRRAGCGKGGLFLLLAGAIPVALTLTPLWWGWWV